MVAKKVSVKIPFSDAIIDALRCAPSDHGKHVLTCARMSSGAKSARPRPNIMEAAIEAATRDTPIGDQRGCWKCPDSVSSPVSSE